MATYLPGDQFDEPFAPRHLNNWEVPALKTTRPNTKVSARTEPTKFIVDERGHIVPGVPKKLTAFVDTTQPPLLTPGRWPETAGRASDPSRFRGPRKATMGYKGIITDYLPRNTTVIKSVMQGSEIGATQGFEYDFSSQ